MQPYFELQRSVDLQQWQPIGERQRAATATPGQLLGVTLDTDEPAGLDAKLPGSARAMRYQGNVVTFSRDLFLVKI
jgi:hypothetical protein